MYLICLDVNGDEEDINIPKDLRNYVDDVIYKIIDGPELIAIIEWLLEYNIKYHSIHEENKEFLFMLEYEAMKFKMRWL